MSNDNYLVNKKKISITLQSGKNVEGYVNIGKHERLSDMFTKDTSAFLIVYDMDLYSIDQKECYFINKNQIELAKPLDND